MIKFKNVFIQYVNEFYTLFDFSCEINSNTLFVGDFFNGTNSILRIISKIDTVYKGNVYINNANLKSIKHKDLDLVYLPEKPILFKNKSLFYNLYFPLKIRKINKKHAKNMIFNMFLKLKNNNFNFLDNQIGFNDETFNNKIITKEEDFKSLKIKKILKLKAKNLSFDEQKMLALIRALLRSPQYVLVENFFEDLNNKHIKLAKFLINELKATSKIIACEKQFNNVYNDFKTIALSK